jgi:hypothetical protein
LSWQLSIDAGETSAAPSRQGSRPRQAVGTVRAPSLLHLGAAGRLGIALAALVALWLAVHWAID